MWGVGYKIACIALGIVGWIVTPPPFVFVAIMALANPGLGVMLGAVAALYAWLAYRAVRRLKSPSAWSFIEPSIVGAVGAATIAAAIQYAQFPRQHWY